MLLFQSVKSWLFSRFSFDQIISLDEPLIFRPADTLSISYFFFGLLILVWSIVLTQKQSFFGTFDVHYYLFLRSDGSTVKALPWLPRDPVCGAASKEPAVHAASDRVTLEGGSGSWHLPTGLSTGSQNTCRTYSTKHVHSMMNKCTKNGTEYSWVWTVSRPSLQRPDVQKLY
jgi:hypothetical protein